MRIKNGKTIIAFSIKPIVSQCFLLSSLTFFMFSHGQHDIGVQNSKKHCIILYRPDVIVYNLHTVYVWVKIHVMYFEQLYNTIQNTLFTQGLWIQTS